MAFDTQGRLWATTAGGPLLQLDPVTGQVLGSYGYGITLAIAVSAQTGTIYVSTNSGISTFDPTSGTFTQWSRDQNLRVNSIAVDNAGNVWAVTWPDRRQVVEFDARQRAVTKLTFDSDIDSLAFGQAGTPLSGLLFVSHNDGPPTSSGTNAAASELTMVDVATLQTVALATGGTRGGVVITTADGRVLLSQTNGVDVIAPAYAPAVIGTNPPNAAVEPLPLPYLTVTFDEDMLADAATDPASVLNPANYTLVGATGGAQAVQSVQYDAATHTALLSFGTLLADSYTLTVGTGVESAAGIALPAAYVTSFTGLGDITGLVSIAVTDTRYDSTTETVSYDLTITNTSGVPLHLPAELVLDPLRDTTGLPQGISGRTDDGRYLIDLSGSLPADGTLLPGGTVAGKTVSIVTADKTRTDFAIGVSATTDPNHAPAFTSTPPTDAVIGQPFSYQATASDADGNAIIYYVLTGPKGLVVDPATGLVQWTPDATRLRRDAGGARGVRRLRRGVDPALRAGRGGRHAAAVLRRPA